MTALPAEDLCMFGVEGCLCLVRPTWLKDHHEDRPRFQELGQGFFECSSGLVLTS